MSPGPHDYPPALAKLLEAIPLAPLGPGRPRVELRREIEAACSALEPAKDRSMASACQAGLWLAFDFLDEAHTLAQDIATPEGSYWHALMHRREPDFSNSKYWFRRVGDHPVYEALREAARDLAAEAPARAAFLARQASWDPFAFVDLCEAGYDEKAPGHELCRRVQRAEWGLLFDHCYRGAVAR
jgi:hypothetical protein